MPQGSAVQPTLDLGSMLVNPAAHASYQFPDACLPFGTLRGACRTVPMRKPSPRNLGVPRRTIRAVTNVLARVQGFAPCAVL